MHTTACRRGQYAVPSVEALSLAFLSVAFPGAEAAAVFSCRKQLERPLQHHTEQQQQQNLQQQQEQSGDNSQQQQHEHSSFTHSPQDTLDDGLVDAAATAAAQEQQQVLQQRNHQHKANGKQQRQQQQQQQREPLIPMVKNWAYHGGMSGRSSSVVHLVSEGDSFGVYIQPGGVSDSVHAQALYQEAAAAAAAAAAGGEGEVGGAAAAGASCLTPRGVYAGHVAKGNQCLSAGELVEFVANTMHANVLPSQFQRPLRGRSVIVSIDDHKEVRPESFLAVELAAAAEARRQGKNILP